MPIFFSYRDVRYPIFSLLLASIVFLWGCSHAPVDTTPRRMAIVTRAPASIGYTVQTGAFSQVNNAIRMTLDLQGKGVDAYYFLHTSGLYKVRFGNYMSLKEAEMAVAALQSSGLVREYYIVQPDEYPAIVNHTIDKARMRTGLVTSAKSFIGVPYQWGGTSDISGFDCSGLAMAVYQLNGISLPRTSQAQWKTGAPVPLEDLAEGDLVFFSGRKNGSITHVGIYIGNGMFIHAPGKGKTIQMDSLSTAHFKEHYQGGRAYL